MAIQPEGAAHTNPEKRVSVGSMRSVPTTSVISPAQSTDSLELDWRNSPDAQVSKRGTLSRMFQASGLAIEAKLNSHSNCQAL
jgi:hypothetical protein